jgi:hypothetical protein
MKVEFENSTIKTTGFTLRKNDGEEIRGSIIDELTNTGDHNLSIKLNLGTGYLNPRETQELLTMYRRIMIAGLKPFSDLKDLESFLAEKGYYSAYTAIYDLMTIDLKLRYRDSEVPEKVAERFVKWWNDALVDNEKPDLKKTLAAYVLIQLLIATLENI